MEWFRRLNNDIVPNKRKASTKVVRHGVECGLIIICFEIEQDTKIAGEGASNWNLNEIFFENSIYKFDFPQCDLTRSVNVIFYTLQKYTLFICQNKQASSVENDTTTSNASFFFRGAYNSQSNTRGHAMNAWPPERTNVFRKFVCDNHNNNNR